MFKVKDRMGKGLNIIIVGYGKVGMTLIEQLTTEGHAITVIDKDSEKVQEAVDVYDVMGIAGNGASHSIQLEAGIDEADLFIAVTESDELNLLCCIIANQTSECSTIARVRTPDYSKERMYLGEKLGLAMIINPELEAANEAARILSLPSALEVNAFAHGHAELIKFKVPENSLLDGMSIAELGKNMHNNLLICAVERKGDITIPSGDYVMSANDVISFVSTRVEAKAFLEKLCILKNKVKDTIIIGGGKVAYYLAKQLLHMGISVKIIEIDRKRCEHLSEILPEAIIINGDGSDQELLKAEGIEYADSVIALTGIDEENILLTLYTRLVSQAKVITKINHITFKDVVASLDLGSVIDPKSITSEAIIAYVRAKRNSKDSNNIETLYYMFDHRVEAIEFYIEKESKVTGIRLMDLKLKKNLLVACISRNGKIIIPSGQECIMPGDMVVVVTTHTGFDKITDILL